MSSNPSVDKVKKFKFERIVQMILIKAKISLIFFITFH